MEGCGDNDCDGKKKRRMRSNEEERDESAGKKRKRMDVDEGDWKKSKVSNESISGSKSDRGKKGGIRNCAKRLNEEEREELELTKKRKFQSREEENETERDGKRSKGKYDQTTYPVFEEKLGRVAGDYYRKGDDSSSGIEFVRGGTSSRKDKKRKRGELEREYEQQQEMASTSCSIDEKQQIKLSGKKRKSTEDMNQTEMISRDGYDDESTLMRTIIVENLPPGKVKKTDLLVQFREFGEIECVRIQSGPLLPTPALCSSSVAHRRHHAYIVFKTQQSAAEACLSHSMVKAENLIQAVRACPPQKKSKGR